MQSEVHRVWELLAGGTVLARSLVAAVPGHPMYPAILRDLERISSYPLPQGAIDASRVADGLGVLAARELDGATGLAAELAETLFNLSGALRRLRSA